MSEEKVEKTSRRQQILEALAEELEKNPGQRITTAGLARAVGVSEAALYRHFPSKAKMFEGLIEFLEETVFGLTTRILNDEKRAAGRCEKILTVMLGFAARNPGISRILMGEVLTGETERLRQRVGQFFDRVETQLKQVLREGEMAGELREGSNIGAIANLMMASVEGRINQYVRSGFKQSPMTEWDEQWPLLAATVFRQQ